MPTRAPMPQWRQRRLAIGRKGELEAEMLRESETLLQPMAKDPIGSKPGSPVSIASSFQADNIQPFLLPDAWTVVGKGGKPVKKMEKMYDEPKILATQTAKTKKKKHKKARPDTEDEPSIITLEEEPSSSKCVRTLQRKIASRNKKVTRAQEAKFWAGYQRDKQIKREALAMLIAALEVDSPLEKDGEEQGGGLGQVNEDVDLKGQSKPAFSCKANAAKDKARRRARSAAATARCFAYDPDEAAAIDFAGPGEGKAESAKVEASRGELDLYLGGDTIPAEVKLPGAWTTVGKRGKPVPQFPPLKPTSKEVLKQPAVLPDAGSKRRTAERVPPSVEDHGNKSAKRDQGKKKCIVM